uniref:Uncharacterized protein n=1 Tax=Denticeps clupeoides TaxID=299321 RepID=A0AAY4AHT5_9TELE
MDAEYAKKHLGRYLTAALVEVVEKRPEDPIEYIAKCLNVYADMEKQQKEKVKAEISEPPPSCLCEHLEEVAANSSAVPPELMTVKADPPQDLKVMKETCPEEKIMELERYCKEELVKLANDRCAKLVASYSKIFEAVIAAKGASTKS